MRITTVQSRQWSGTSRQHNLVADIFGGKLFGGSAVASQWYLCGSWNSLRHSPSDTVISYIQAQWVQCPQGCSPTEVLLVTGYLLCRQRLSFWAHAKMHWLFLESPTVCSQMQKYSVFADTKVTVNAINISDIFANLNCRKYQIRCLTDEVRTDLNWCFTGKTWENGEFWSGKWKK